MAEQSKALLLGERLVQCGLISSQQLEQALEEQKSTKQLLGVVLLKKGFIREEDVFFPLLAQHLGSEYVSLKEETISPECVAKVPAQFAAYYRVMPFRLNKDQLLLATPNPFDQTAKDGIQLIWSGRIHMVMASEQDVTQAIRRYYGVGAETIDAMMGSRAASGSNAEEIDDITELDSEASIGKFLNQILLEAYKKRATDIHIEPFESDLKIRYRIDGVLSDIQVPKNIWHFRDAISSRVKIMSNLNIAERRLPQDGRFKVRVGGVDLDLRVSFLPTPNGESIVLRLLSSAKLSDLAELGFGVQQLKILNDLLRRPHGIIFVTGPTGSGKTTTLYCCLSEVADVDKKIITIEDPIEYLIKGVTQIQVNPRINFTFATGLRSMLRHDPDIMMVGEVRDLETAEIAIQVALTGHLVFSTLHTNDAVGAVTRLLDMGIEPYLVSSSVEAFIAQRLVRRLCPHCKKKVLMTARNLQELGFPAEKDTVVYEGAGCQACDFSGYYGREGIFEFLVMNDQIRDLIVAKAPALRMKEAAVNAGMQSLLQDGWLKITQGKTTVSEVVRVTKEDSLSEE
jgi:type II secretion system protein E